MIKTKGSGIFNDRNAMGKLPLHRKMGEYFPHQTSNTNLNLKENTEITDAGVVDDGTAEKSALQPKKAQKSVSKYPEYSQSMEKHNISDASIDAYRQGYASWKAGILKDNPKAKAWKYSKQQYNLTETGKSLASALTGLKTNPTDWQRP